MADDALNDAEIPSSIDEHTRGWSCYTTPPAQTLDIFEAARARCPVAHSSEHDAFYLLLDFKDVRQAMGDHDVFSPAEKVLRPVIDREPIPGLEMDPPRHGAWRNFTRAPCPRGLPRPWKPS